MKKNFIVVIAVIMLLALSACGKKWTCDQCGIEFTGKAYYDYTETMTLCEDCARTYWMPLPYQNYQK